MVYHISVGRALTQSCISQSKGTKEHLQNISKWHVFKIHDKRSWKVKWKKALPAPEGWLCSPGSGPCTVLYQNRYLMCSQPCRSFYETLVDHDVFAHACSLPGGSSEAAAGFWGSDAGCLMFSSTAVARRQLPGIVPGEQKSCLAPQHPAHVPLYLHIWCWKVGEMRVPGFPEKMAWGRGPC